MINDSNEEIGIGVEEMSIGVEGSTHRARLGELRQSLGGELSYILSTVVMRASEKLAMRVGLMQRSESATCVSLCRHLGKYFKQRRQPENVP